MRNTYSKPLYELYKKSQNWRNEFLKRIEFLITNESGIDTFEQGLMDYGNDSFPINISIPTFQTSIPNKRDFSDKALNEANKELNEFRSNWRNDVEKILDKLPQISFMMRFENPKSDIRLKGVRMEYLNYSLTDDMDKFLDSFDEFSEEVDELYEIINDYEKSIYQPSDFEFDEEEPKRKKNAVYRLRYDEMLGKLYLNDVEIYKCNLESRLDKALTSAFETPEKAVVTEGSISTAISQIKMPKSLKRLMFRVSKGRFIVNPEVTSDDLTYSHLNKKEIDEEIQKLSK